MAATVPQHITIAFTLAAVSIRDIIAGDGLLDRRSLG
jgi:hypothetical protein